MNSWFADEAISLLQTRGSWIFDLTIHDTFDPHYRVPTLSAIAINEPPRSLCVPDFKGRRSETHRGTAASVRQVRLPRALFLQTSAEAIGNAFQRNRSQSKLGPRHRSL